MLHRFYGINSLKDAVSSLFKYEFFTELWSGLFRYWFIFLLAVWLAFWMLGMRAVQWILNHWLVNEILRRSSNFKDVWLVPECLRKWGFCFSRCEMRLFIFRVLVSRRVLNLKMKCCREHIICIHIILQNGNALHMIYKAWVELD